MATILRMYSRNNLTTSHVCLTMIQHFRTIYSTTHRTICTTTAQMACSNASGLHREVHCSNLGRDTRFFLASLCPSGQMLRYYIKLGVISSLRNLYNQYSPTSNFSTLCGLIHRQRREIHTNTSTYIYMLVSSCRFLCRPTFSFSTEFMRYSAKSLHSEQTNKYLI